jgi:3-phenylpropionate/trans-cinnamate dioxygenase ferredoxin subunit
MSQWVDVAALGELAPGEHRVVEADGVEIAVFNLAGEYHAIENVCTHDGGTLSGGWLDGEAIVCPRHGARFSVKTGAVLAPPAYEPVHTFPIRIHDGRIQVRDDRWD